MPWIAIIISTVIIDRLAKLAVIKKINIGDSITVIDNFFYLTYWENKGAAWGILQNGRPFLIILTSVIVVVMLYVLAKSTNWFLNISLSLVIGGAIGNLFDRAARGSVTDFLEFKFGSYHFPIFNAADTFVVIGTILLSYYLLFIHKDKQTEEAGKQEQTD